MDAKNFEVGQVWVTREGGEATITKVYDGSMTYPVRADVRVGKENALAHDIGFDLRGRFYAIEDDGEHSTDLISLKPAEGIQVADHVHPQVDSPVTSAPEVLAASSDIATDRIEVELPVDVTTAKPLPDFFIEDLRERVAQHERNAEFSQNAARTLQAQLDEINDSIAVSLERAAFYRSMIVVPAILHDFDFPF